MPDMRLTANDPDFDDRPARPRRHRPRQNRHEQTVECLLSRCERPSAERGHALKLVKTLHDRGLTYDEIIDLVNEWWPQRSRQYRHVTTFHAWLKRGGVL